MDESFTNVLIPARLAAEMSKSPFNAFAARPACRWPSTIAIYSY